MPRMIDWECSCGRIERDSLASPDDTRTCSKCGASMTQNWLPRVRHDAQWSDHDAVLVHVNPKTGEVSYPARHEAKLRAGYERVYLRSLSEVNRFEREHGVMNHVMHYDSNGRGIDDTYRGQKEGWSH